MKAVKNRYAKSILQPPLDTASHTEVATASGIRPLNWYEKARYGLFDHYTFGGTGLQETRYDTGVVPASLDALANDFDAARFAADAAAFGVEYVTFTAWHYAMNVLYPSAVMNSVLPGHATTTRDVIADLIAACKPYGIKVMLYVHLTDGMDLTAPEQVTTGWNDATNGYATWNTFISNLLTECSNRYGLGLDGYWVDMVQGADFTLKINPALVKDALYAGNPNRVIVGNQGTSDDSWPDKTGAFGILHRSRELNPHANPWSGVVAGYDQTLALAAKSGVWWAQVPKTSASVVGDPVDMFRFLVLQAGTVKSGGGLCLNAGNYAGSGASLWEPGVETALKAIAALLKPLSASLQGVRRSTSFPTPNTATVLTVPNGFVATQSLDGHTEYIHVLNAPGTSTLTLPAALDAATVAFVSGRNLVTGRPVTVALQNGGGYKVTLHPLDSWSTVDTVIALDRAPVAATASPSQIWIGPPLWMTNNTATLGSQALGSRFAGWTMGPDTDTQIQTTYVVPPDWNTYDVDMYVAQTGAGSGIAYFFPNHSQLANGGLATVGDENPPNVMLTVPGVVNQLVIKTLLRRQGNVRGTLNHLRLQRYASFVNDTAPTVVFLGALLRRTS